MARKAIFSYKLVLLLASIFFALSKMSLSANASVLESNNLSNHGVTFVHLFEWKWKDVALECERYLGPAGYHGVQISPPQEHINHDSWWARYQPVSYQLKSRGGNLSEFKEMINRCHRAGVKVYADVVINHMSGGTGIGFAGTYYEKFSYPQYSREDFHSSCGLFDYHNRWQVQNCDLVGLADLKTESNSVQTKIAAYISKLVSLGVDGIRIDAAKHIPATDLKKILNKVQGNPYIFQEVIDLGNEPIKAHEYFDNGSVTEFKYGRDLARVFKGGKLSWLKTFGEYWDFMPDSRAVVFLDNHDNQRGHGGNVPVLSYKDDKLYALAHIAMLAWPYGYPKVMSSYRFNHPDQAPPRGGVYNSDGSINCFGEWICEHRWKAIVNMMRFRGFTAGTSIKKWWTDGENQVAFARGDKGFVVINNSDDKIDKWFDTGLKPGKYCNVIKGHKKRDNYCSGNTITVNPYGWAKIKVEPVDGVAIHIGSMLD